MNIKEIVQEILNDWQEEGTILEISKTGSQINRDDPNDLDYLIVCDQFEQRARKYVVEIEGQVYDLMFRSLLSLKKQLDFTDTGYVHKGHEIYNYCFPIRERVYGSLNYEWDMLSHEQEYIEHIKNKYMNTVGQLKVKTNYTKPFVHYYIILKMFENQKLEITPEMKKNIEILYNSGPESAQIIDWIEIKLFGDILEVINNV